CRTRCRNGDCREDRTSGYGTAPRARRHAWPPVPACHSRCLALPSCLHQSSPLSAPRCRPHGGEVEGFCCPVPSEPRLTLLEGRASSTDKSNCITQREQSQHSCHKQLFW